MRMHSLSQYQPRISNEPRRSTTYSQLISTPTSNSTQINSIIECLICSNHVRQAHMCPSCCKMFCESCIKNHIRVKRAECPACFKALTQAALLNCSILGRQIQQALSKSVSKIRTTSLTSSGLISPSGARIVFPKTQSSPINQSPVQPQNSEIACQKHQLKLDYYCQTCKFGLCSDCAVLSTNHQGHRLCRISHKKLKFKQLIGQLQKNIFSSKIKVSGVRQEALQILEKIKLSENEKQTILVNYLNHIFRITCEKHEKIFKQRQQYIYNFRHDFQSLEKQYNSTEKSIKQFSKCKLIKDCSQIERQIGQLLKIQKNVVQPIPVKIQSEIVPEYEQKTYILDNYSHLRQKGDILISEPLFFRGTQWRLKIFPGGVDYETNKGLDQYLAIHLQMSKGHQQVNWYKYRIQLVNQANRSKCMSFEFENDFKEGSEWGLDNFIKISALYTQNFIHPTEGYIQVILYVRCLSYYHSVRDQKQLIAAKQTKINENHHTILSLRKKATQMGLKSDIISQANSCSSISTWNSKEHLSNSNHQLEIKKIMAVDEND